MTSFVDTVFDSLVLLFSYYRTHLIHVFLYKIMPQFCLQCRTSLIYSFENCYIDIKNTYEKLKRALRRMSWNKPRWVADNHHEEGSRWALSAEKCRYLLWVFKHRYKCSLFAKTCIKHDNRSQKLHVVGPTNKGPKNFIVYLMKSFNYKYIKIKQTIHQIKTWASLKFLECLTKTNDFF